MVPIENNTLDKLSDLQIDALRELGTMGAGHAASALSEFLEQEIFMKVPSVKITAVDTIPELLMNRFQPHVQLAIASASNLTELFYSVLVLFDQDTVSEILDQKSPPDEDLETLMEFSTIFMSLIEEIGSIILLKYINTLNMFLSISLALPTQPTLRIGTLDSLKNFELNSFKKESTIIFIESDVYSKDDKHIHVEIILIPHSETYDRFLGTLFTQHLV